MLATCDRFMDVRLFPPRLICFICYFPLYLILSGRVHMKSVRYKILGFLSYQAFNRHEDLMCDRGCSVVENEVENSEEEEITRTDI